MIINRDGWISNSNASKRYHPQKWRKTAKWAKALTRGKCVCCSSPATEVHHEFYGLPIVYPIVILSSNASLSNPWLPSDWCLFQLCGAQFADF
jgi:hypothetical protein